MKKSTTTSLHKLLIVLACCLCLGGGALYAQEITGTIAGTVTDASGAVVPGATITITDTAKQTVVRTVTTGESGEYAAPQLPVGVYDVTVEAPNFKKYVTNNVKLDVNQRRTVDATLETGNISEIVTVESTPLQVDTQTPTSGNLISGTQVRELSLNNRNFIQLMTLTPGVSADLADQIYVGTTNPSGQANTVSVSVNGARSSANTFSVDGADTTDRGSNLTIQTYPSVDAIGEFRVLRSLYPAEIGRSGGGQVNVVTRSGTNDFHGTLYEFVRNDKLNANDFFSNRSAPLGRDANGKAKRPPLRYNNFGYTIGGPLYLPRFGEGGKSYYSGKNRTFFFFSEEFRRVISYPVFSATIPDRNLRSGIFPVPVCISPNGTTCASILPPGTPLPNINPVAQAYINAIYAPLGEPNAPNFVLNSVQRNIFNFRQEIIKIDHKFSENLSAFYRFENDNIPTIDANGLFSSGASLPGVSTTSTNSPGRSHVARFTYTINPTTIIDGGFLYSYGAILSQVIGKIAQQNSPSINVPLPFQSSVPRIPSLTGIGFNGVTGFGPYNNFSNNKSVTANLTKIIGGHTFKAGVLLNWYRKNENALAGNNEGLFSGFVGTTNPALPSLQRFYQQFANFLQGNVGTFTQAKFDYTADLRIKNNEAYFQDEWRIRPNLTLYYGLRYSRFGEPVDRNNQLTNFDPTRFNSANAPLVTGGGNRVAGTGDPLNGIIVNTQNIPAGIPSPYGEAVSNTQNNFAPRVGLAWDPFGKGTTSIRTGYGLYYDTILNGIYEQNIGANPPFQQSVTIAGARLDNPSAGVVSVSAAAPSLRGVPLPYKTPYMQQWSLDVQHQLFRNTLIDVGYFGSKGTHLLGIVDINLLPPGFALTQTCVNSAGATVPCQAPGQQFTSATQELILDQIRPFRGYRAINVIQSRFNSNYNSLQFYLQQRFAGNSLFNLAYTFSKNLTDNQTDRSTAPQNPYRIRADYGRAQLDRRHILTANFVYDLPFYTAQRGFTGRLLGGWELSGIFTYNSGLPFTVTTSNLDPAGIGLLGPSASGPRPDMVCDPNSGAPHTITQWFNTQCFKDVPPGENRIGNAGRGVVNGPPTTRFDFTLMKNIRFSETARLQLRGEAFNIFNHTNFRGLSTNITSSTYGQVITTRDPRIIQLGVKFYF